MRTTLSIDDDIFLAAKEKARLEGRSIGDLVSDALRESFLSSRKEIEKKTPAPAEFMGFRPFPSRGGIVTEELINSIRDEEGI